MKTIYLIILTIIALWIVLCSDCTAQDTTYTMKALVEYSKQIPDSINTIVPKQHGHYVMNGMHGSELPVILNFLDAVLVDKELKTKILYIINQHKFHHMTDQSIILKEMLVAFKNYKAQ